jgi:hypothetical protein
LSVGEEWYEEDRKAIRAGPAGEVVKNLVAIENKYQTEMAEQFKAESPAGPSADIAKSLADFKSAMAKFQAMRSEVIELIYQLRKELIEGDTFVHDRDLGTLDVQTVARAVELRLTLAGLLESLAGLFQSLEVFDEKDVRDYAKGPVVEAVLAAIRAGYAMKFLMVRCDVYVHRKWFAAIKANLFA